MLIIPRENTTAANCMMKVINIPIVRNIEPILSSLFLKTLYVKISMNMNWLLH